MRGRRAGGWTGDEGGASGMAGKVLGGVCRVRVSITGSVSGKQEVLNIWRAVSTCFMSHLTFSGSSSTFSATYKEMIETNNKQTHTETVSGIISKIQLFNSMITWTLQGTIYNINLTLYKQHLLYRVL